MDKNLMAPGFVTISASRGKVWEALVNPERKTNTNVRPQPWFMDWAQSSGVSGRGRGRVNRMKTKVGNTVKTEPGPRKIQIQSISARFPI